MCSGQANSPRGSGCSFYIVFFLMFFLRKVSDIKGLSFRGNCHLVVSKPQTKANFRMLIIEMHP